MRSNELKLFHQTIMVTQWKNEIERSHSSSSIEIYDLSIIFVACLRTANAQPINRVGDVIIRAFF